ncbi:MAG TPA: THUMP domain-containing protein [Oligoflexia bacterium]|nr:THUMP domain-containing protein [Oligoflexia bacterium]
MQKSFFAVTAKGLEPALAEELRALGALNIEERPGGVAFAGNQETLYKACLWLRTATRVLQEIRTFSARSPEMLYDQIRRLKWHELLTAEMTFAVDCVASGTRVKRESLDEDFENAPPRPLASPSIAPTSPSFAHRRLQPHAVDNRLQPRFVALKIKDGIADEMRKRLNGVRPSVDAENPDVLIHAYLNDGKCVLSIDASGASMHERGYRKQDSGAPLRETLAAGLVLMTEWPKDTSQPFIDLMCGGGTLCIEAALIGANIAPGLLRTKRFGFETWRDFDKALWNRLRSEAVAARSTTKLNIQGFDMNELAIEAARSNARRASVDKLVRFELGRIENLPSNRVPTTAGTVIVNPPYGERMGAADRLKPLYKRLGDAYKHQFKGWKGFIFSGNSDATKSVGLRTSRRIPLFNGPIECRLLRYELY